MLLRLSDETNSAVGKQHSIPKKISKKHHLAVNIFFENSKLEDWEISLRSSRKKVKEISKPVRLPSLQVSPIKTASFPIVAYDLLETTCEDDNSFGIQSLFLNDSFGNDSFDSLEGIGESSLSQNDFTSLSTKPTENRVDGSASRVPIVLTNERVEKYFGVNAQHHFHATYRELIHRKNICVGGADELISMVSTVGNNSKAGSRCNSQGGNRLSPSGLVNAPDSASPFSFDSIGASVKQLRARKVLSPIGTARTSSPNVLVQSPKESISVGTSETSKMYYAIPRNSLSHKKGKVVKVSLSNISVLSSDESYLNSLSNQRSLNNSTISDITGLEGEYESNDAVADDSSTKNRSSVLESVNIPELELNNVLLDDEAFKNEITLSTYSANSPRAKFLAGCIKCNLPPRALTLLRHRLTTVLNLEHFGLGDKFGVLLASSFGALPAVKVLNV